MACSCNVLFIADSQSKLLLASSYQLLHAQHHSFVAWTYVVASANTMLCWMLLSSQLSLISLPFLSSLRTAGKLIKY